MAARVFADAAEAQAEWDNRVSHGPDCRRGLNAFNRYEAIPVEGGFIIRLLMPQEQTGDTPAYYEEDGFVRTESGELRGAV